MTHEEEPQSRRTAPGWALSSGPGLALLWMMAGPGDFAERSAAATGIWMAAWWITEAIPLHWTALLPLALHPLGGTHRRGPIGDLGMTGAAFLDAYLLLFLGGMVLGAAIERSGLHRRLALTVLGLVGGGAPRVLGGVLLATALVSAWISNTATAVMMLPIAVSLVARLEVASRARLPAFGTALLLAVAYGANVGGMATKIGSGTNSIFCGVVYKLLGVDLGFFDYALLALPFVALLLPLAWAVLWGVARRDLALLPAVVPVREELRALGAMSFEERKVAAIFLATALAWMAGDAIRPYVVPLVPQVWEGFRFQGKHWEALVGLAAALGCVGARVVGLADFIRLPWGALALLGGSFAMAQGIESSGLSTRMGEAVAGVAGWPLWVQAGLAAAASVGLSAVASNTATVNVLLQVLPRSLPVLTVAALGASCDFALPAGTPPNAIVFGSGRVRLPDMVRIGLALDGLAILLLAAYAATWLSWVAPGP